MKRFPGVVPDASPTDGSVLTVLVGRARARIFLSTPDDTSELIDVAAPFIAGKFRGDRRGAPGQGERHFHNRIQQERARHFESVTAEVRRLVRAHDVRYLVLGGAGRETAAYAASLDRDLAPMVAGTIGLSPSSATPSKVRLFTLAVTSAARAAAEQERVQEAIGNVGHGVLHFN